MADDTARYFDAAKNLAVDILRKESARTPERIREVAELGARVGTMMGVAVDIDALTAELRHIFSVTIENATILEDRDPKAHSPWLQGCKAEIEWRFWRRYMLFLEREFGMAPTAVNALDDLTDMILGRMENPLRDGLWDRRGMVVGSVQSGKTANYTGLICKAVDSGYKLVIVLAGIHSNLRSQTQLRIDEGVLGVDSQKGRHLNKDSHVIGAGRFSAPGEILYIHPLTNSAEDGDFNKRVADNAGVMLGSDPVVLVVKKNSRLLGNLLKWVLHVAATEDPQTKRKLVRDVPLLLIDDEADNASIDTGQKKKSTTSVADSVTAINGKIREILAAFEKAVYVGYTATPFANIFINPQAETDKHGGDIFPRSFIINVKPPSNYIGPTRVFGLAGDPDAGIDGESALPIVGNINDYDTPSCFPPGHKKNHVPTELPGSLRHALRCFLLACAARRARGQQVKHNSMLVHVTRFTDVQSRVEELIRDELRPLQRRLEYGDGAQKPTLRDELRELWEKEFVPVSRSMGEDSGLQVTWEQVNAELHPAGSKINVMKINGMATDVLDYKANEADGLSIIAVGGDKLSRGLTLEGLSVSYFLRTSRMYDTLMQMGRWFGYRPGYLDLCRLFTTQQLVGWYRHIALAEIELRREFDYMVAANLEPVQYGLRVRTHPDGMIITALNKMCHSEELTLSWSGLLVQTTHVPIDIMRVSKNLEATHRLLGGLGAPVSNRENMTRCWKDVDAFTVASYLEDLAFPKESTRATGKQVADFIRKQATKEAPELTSWTVALISSQTADRPAQIGGYNVGLVKRRPPAGMVVTKDSYPLRNANILSPEHQALDLKDMPFTQNSVEEAAASAVIAADVEELGDGGWSNLAELALAITHRRIENGRLHGDVKTNKVANGRVVRELRPKKCGLLLVYPLAPLSDVGLSSDGPPIIGIALSFPASDTVDGVEYRVNRVWDSEMQEDAAYED
jgi:hypothetical protein